jgi:hypothetical protein
MTLKIFGEMPSGMILQIFAIDGAGWAVGKNGSKDAEGGIGVTSESRKSGKRGSGEARRPERWKAGKREAREDGSPESPKNAERGVTESAQGAGMGNGEREMENGKRGKGEKEIGKGKGEKEMERGVGTGEWGSEIHSGMGRGPKLASDDRKGTCAGHSSRLLAVFPCHFP